MIQPEASFSRRPHGANPEKLYAAMGLSMPERIVDFSVNTNVLPPPVMPEIDLIRCLSEYPDDDALALRTLVVEREGCSLDEVLFTNGSNEALYLLASLFVGTTAAVLQPAYGEYRRALGAFGVPTTDIFDLRDVEGKALVFVCNPCNPTGSCIPFGELEARARANPRTLFAVDQAYSDFLLPDGEEVSPDFGALPNILLLRSLTKLYHLSIPRGQTEAALSQGFTYVETMRYIILPQAFRIILPPLINQVVNLIKNTSTVAIISGMDLMFVTKSWSALNSNYIPAFAGAALLYFLLCFPIASWGRRVEEANKQAYSI